MDVKSPIFPTGTAEESWGLIQALAKRQGIELNANDYAQVSEHMPLWLTPGAAEALAVKLYRTLKTAPPNAGLTPIAALRQCLDGYRNPVARETMEFQIKLAITEASDIEFVPEYFRKAISIANEGLGIA